MRRAISAITLLAILCVSCSSGPSDAQVAWCGSHGKEVALGGRALGLTTADGPLVVSWCDVPHTPNPDVDPNSLEGLREKYRTCDVGGSVSFASQGDYDRACKAAYEGR